MLLVSWSSFIAQNQNQLSVDPPLVQASSRAHAATQDLFTASHVITGELLCCTSQMQQLTNQYTGQQPFSLFCYHNSFMTILSVFPICLHLPLFFHQGYFFPITCQNTMLATQTSTTTTNTMKLGRCLKQKQYKDLQIFFSSQCVWGCICCC